MAQPQQRVDYPKRKSGEMQWRHYNMRRIKIEQRQASIERCLAGHRGRARRWFPWLAQASIIFWRCSLVRSCAGRTAAACRWPWSATRSALTALARETAEHQTHGIRAVGP